MFKLTNNINKAKTQFKQNKSNTLNEIGIFIKDRMDYYAPVDTGYLRSRNNYKVMNDSVLFLNDCEYAIFQEYGTRYQSGTPFMRPAAFNHLGDIQRIAINYLSRGF